MIENSILITVMGMGSVFFFLFVLVCFMNLMHVLVQEFSKKDLNKQALAVVLALKAKKGK
jgi:sodium pump decarboxylase gamma subunit